MSDRPQAMIVSIHDVAPATVPRVVALADWLRPFTPSADLLIVAGGPWRPEQIDALHRLQAEGFQLAGHGWLHTCRARKDLYHRLHSRILSRNVAEHLSRDEGEIAALIERSYDWFGRHGLRPPRLYVPPAWAMGRISRRRLRSLPYRYYEYLDGIYDAAEDRFHSLSLLGYEADTALRKRFLRWFNRCNWRRAVRRGWPLRVAIHPGDLQARLADDLRRDLEQRCAARCGDAVSILTGQSAWTAGEAPGRGPESKRRSVMLPSGSASAASPHR